MEAAVKGIPGGVPEAGTAHVWVVSLAAAASDPAACADWLSAAEQERCRRIDDQAARARYALGRRALRAVLGSVLDTDPAALVFTRGERGKPAVAGADTLEFSFSHSRESAVIAVATSAVGVDAEHDRRARRPVQTAQRIFHPDTAATLTALPPHSRTAAFLAAWTQREAHVKAVGGGLFHTADALPFDPALPADGAPRLVPDRVSGEPWSVAHFAPAAASFACVVVRGELHALHFHHHATLPFDSGGKDR